MTCLLDIGLLPLTIVFEHLVTLKDRGALRRTCKNLSKIRSTEEEIMKRLVSDCNEREASDLLREALDAPEPTTFSVGFISLVSYHARDAKTLALLSTIVSQRPKRLDETDFDLNSACVQSMFNTGWPIEESKIHQNYDILRACGSSCYGSEMMMALCAGKLSSYYWILNYMTPLGMQGTGHVYRPLGDQFRKSMPRLIDLEYFLKFVDTVIKPDRSTTKDLLHEYGVLRRTYREWKRFLELAGMRKEDFPRVAHVYCHFAKVFARSIVKDELPCKRRRKTPSATKKMTKTD